MAGAVVQRGPQLDRERDRAHRRHVVLVLELGLEGRLRGGRRHARAGSRVCVSGLAGLGGPGGSGLAGAAAEATVTGTGTSAGAPWTRPMRGDFHMVTARLRRGVSPDSHEQGSQTRSFRDRVGGERVLERSGPGSYLEVP